MPRDPHAQNIPQVPLIPSKPANVAGGVPPCLRKYLISNSKVRLLYKRTADFDSFYGICPETSPDGLDIAGIDNQAANFEKFSGSCAGLTADTCAQYGFYSADNGTFLDPTALPAAGTNPLSTTAGPSSLTSPPAGETLTWSLDSQTFTVTAAPYNAKNAGSGTTTTGTAASATGSGATGTTSKGSTGTTTATGTILTGPVKTGAATKLQGFTESWNVGLLSLIAMAVML